MSDSNTPFREQQGFLATKLSRSIKCLDDPSPENLEKASEMKYYLTKPKVPSVLTSTEAEIHTY